MSTPQAFQESLQKILTHKDLIREEAKDAFCSLLDNSLSAEKISAFLIALKMKGESFQEIAGFADALSEAALQVSVENENLIDVCGTGGDNSGSFNVSTTVAFVLAAGGQAVAKHGNRSVSSRSGSFDLLEALGVPFNSSPESVKDSISKHRIAFLFAPAFHPALKNLAVIRKNLGISTVMNILGPLLNPVAQVKKQVLGVYSPLLIDKLANVLLARGATQAMVVHGHGGLDEFSLSGPTQVAFLQNGKITHQEIDPQKLGISQAPQEALKGGDPEENAKILIQIFKGEKGPKRDIVILNAGAAFYVSGKARDFQEGIELARESLDSGKALQQLEAMRLL